MQPAATTDVLLVSPDLFLGSRIRGTVESQGRSLSVASTGHAAAERLDAGNYRLVLIDLQTPGLDLTDLRQRRTARGEPAFVAYGPHVQAPLLRAARAAGCDEVLTRGQFDASIRDVLNRFLEPTD
jgi:CheY-like chemotaxis protein